VKLPAPLDRPFRIIAFDWDGTAVASRADDATPVRGPIERLLRVGVLVVVITGTNLANVDGQLSRAIRGRHKRNLYLATNRGSEVYGFDDAFLPVPIHRVTASRDQERALTEIADAVRDELVSRTGLEVRVVYDRLNRRKIDLIPVERWKDPPKSALGDLLLAVQSRLEGAGLRGGLRHVIERTREIARAKGLPDARITSDVKHVEVGLTDKADSVRWILTELAAPRRIAARDMLVGGDELGSIAGVPGSDSFMRVQGSEDATFVSVGPEPAGVPPGVLHLGGGPARFRDLLASQASLHPVRLPATPERDPEWHLGEDGFVLTREHEIESIFAIGNGFVGSRGALAEGSALSLPATYVAGFFDHEAGSVPGLARAPDWAHLAGKMGGRTLELESGEILEHRRELDMRQGILWRHWRHRDESGRITRVEGMRLASLADRHLLLQSITLTPENYSARLTVESAALSRAVTMRTTSGLAVELVAASRIEDPEGIWALPPPNNHDPIERWTLDAELGRTYRLDRLACVNTSRESDELAGSSIRARLQQAHEAGFERAVDAHRAAWRARWERSDLRITGDPEAQRAIRFAIYHLVSAANPNDERVSIGARGLTGPAYKGHVFWDTEVFMLPFFTLTYPEAARALLMYRYHTLGAARARAARVGYRGALYAWESADTGEDVTPPYVIAPTGELIRILVGEEEHHISADVAYGVWSYWDATHDERFLLEAGAEILVETARFWASRAQLEADGAHHIRKVIGPDEYHESVDDNAYTNGMAQWNLETGAHAVAMLEARWPDRWRELSARLRFSADEPAEWLRVARGLRFNVDPETGVIEQFEGYFGLEDIDLASFEPRTAPIDVLLPRERVQRSKVIKQPDVVMLMYLLWDRFAPEVRAANFRYYDPRTSQGSSLSPPIQSVVAARLGEVELAERYFRETAAVDLANTMGNAAGGVHVASLAGLWQSVVFGFAGVTLGADGPRLHPHLPARWKQIALELEWRGERVAIDVRSGAEPQAEAHP
jgi:trehalose/maltose hydrolase-like predicted phosphorylase